jgi:hypothetical protein
MIIIIKAILKTLTTSTASTKHQQRQHQQRQQQQHQQNNNNNNNVKHYFHSLKRERVKSYEYYRKFVSLLNQETIFSEQKAQFIFRHEENT